MLEYTRKRIQEFPQLCRQAGLRLTPQRAAIFTMLAATHSHPTPEEVYSHIHQSIPSISLATIYKILDLFHKRGFIRKVSTRGQAARYDANPAAHHHLICTRCGCIRDLPVDPEDNQGASFPEPEGFVISSYEIQYHGRCGRCPSQGNP